MGFDPRDWPSRGRSSRPITGNLDALLDENAALKQEVLRLRGLPPGVGLNHRFTSLTLRRCTGPVS